LNEVQGSIFKVTEKRKSHAENLAFCWGSPRKGSTGAHLPIFRWLSQVEEISRELSPNAPEKDRLSAAVEKLLSLGKKFLYPLARHWP
jgi:hypothetical protein